MYESVILEPDYENATALMEAIAEHNSTYHNEDPYKSLVWNISTGPNVGKLVWMMGPCTYSDLDNRPSGEHDKHWAEKVLVNLEGQSHGEYWRLNDEISYEGNGEPNQVLRIRFLELARGQGYRLNGLLKKISEVVKAKDSGAQWNVYVNEFQQGYTIGRHIALVSGHTSWADFDEEDSMVEDYEKHHGEGSWQPFLNEWDDIIANSWDEIWTFDANMSSSDDE